MLAERGSECRSLHDLPLVQRYAPEMEPGCAGTRRNPSDLARGNTDET